MIKQPGWVTVEPPPYEDASIIVIFREPSFDYLNERSDRVWKPIDENEEVSFP